MYVLCEGPSLVCNGAQPSKVSDRGDSAVPLPGRCHCMTVAPKACRAAIAHWLQLAVLSTMILFDRRVGASQALAAGGTQHL